MGSGYASILRVQNMCYILLKAFKGGRTINKGESLPKCPQKNKRARQKKHIPKKRKHPDPKSRGAK